MLIVKAYRSNSDNCMTKMETLKEVARVLRIGPSVAFRLIRDMKYQTALNAREQVHQMKESQQYVLEDQDINAFERVFEDDFQYKPDPAKIKVKEDRIIDYKGYVDLDFNVFQRLTRLKENCFVKFARFYKTK